MKPSRLPAAMSGFFLAVTPALAQFIETATPPPPSLKEVDLPTVVDKISGLALIDEATPDGANGFIRNEQAAILLLSLIHI